MTSLNSDTALRFLTDLSEISNKGIVSYYNLSFSNNNFSVFPGPLRAFVNRFFPPTNLPAMGQFTSLFNQPQGGQR